jgi:hypothetical protein
MNRFLEVKLLNTLATVGTSASDENHALEGGVEYSPKKIKEPSVTLF